MFAKSLVVFVSVGVFSGFLFGIFLIDMKNTSEVIYVDGASISLLTEKYDYKKGEQIKIRVINSGTFPLHFPDNSYGLRVTGLSGMLIYSSPMPVISKLDPKEETEFIWNQTKNDGNQVLEGLYKIHAAGISNNKEKVERATTVHVWK